MPKEVRQEAYRLLRHYPTVSDIEAIAEHEERLRALTQSAFVRPYLSSEIEADWFSGTRSALIASDHEATEQAAWKRDYVCGDSAGGFL